MLSSRRGTDTHDNGDTDERKLRQIYEAHGETGDFLEEALAMFDDRTERSIKLKYKKLGIITRNDRVWVEEVDYKEEEERLRNAA